MFTFGEILGYGSAVAVLVIVCVFVAVYVARHWQRCRVELTKEEMALQRAEKSGKIFRIEDVFIDKSQKLGSGNFGDVYSGVLKANNLNKPVAVKILKNDDDNKKEALKEAAVHLEMPDDSASSHLLGLVGIVKPSRLSKFNLNWRKFFFLSENFGNNISKFQNNWMILTEKMDTALDTYLKTDQNQVSLLNMLDFCIQITDGLNYLHSSARVILHRDLGCRNVLLYKNDQAGKMHLKLTDFGLSAIMKSFRGGAGTEDSSEMAIAIPFNAFESLQFQVDRNSLPRNFASFTSTGIDSAISASTYNTVDQFSTKSDIWQLAIVYWEIFSRAQFTPFLTPNQTVFSNNNKYFKDLMIKIVIYYCQGRRLDKPLKMPAKIFDLCLRSWVKTPEERPSAKDLLGQLCYYRDKIEDLNLEGQKSTISFGQLPVFNKEAANVNYNLVEVQNRNIKCFEAGLMDFKFTIDERLENPNASKESSSTNDSVFKYTEDVYINQVRLTHSPKFIYKCKNKNVKFIATGEMNPALASLSTQTSMVKSINSGSGLLSNVPTAGYGSIGTTLNSVKSLPEDFDRSWNGSDEERWDESIVQDEGAVYGGQKF